MKSDLIKKLFFPEDLKQINEEWSISLFVVIFEKVNLLLTVEQQNTFRDLLSGKPEEAIRFLNDLGLDIKKIAQETYREMESKFSVDFSKKLLELSKEENG